jgi:hypothetical protein
VFGVRHLLGQQQLAWLLRAHYRALRLQPLTKQQRGAFLFLLLLVLL